MFKFLAIAKISLLERGDATESKNEKVPSDIQGEKLKNNGKFGKTGLSHIIKAKFRCKTWTITIYYVYIVVE